MSSIPKYDKTGTGKRVALLREIIGAARVPSAHAARIARLRRLAWLMDGAARIPFTRFRFGLGGLVGLPPGLGDAALTGVSLYIVWEAYRMGVPRPLLARMVGNVAIQGVAGAVPLAGDLFDATFKANLRNLAILERWEAR